MRLRRLRQLRTGGLGIELVPLAAVIAVSAATAAQPLDADLWFNLNIGRFLATTGRLPYPDPFTFGAGDAVWTAHEWLPDYVVYQLVTRAGVGLTTLVFGAVSAATWLIVERALRAVSAAQQRRSLASEVRGWLRDGVWPDFDDGALEPYRQEAGVLRFGRMGSATLRHLRAAPMVDQALVLLEADLDRWFGSEFLDWYARVLGEGGI